MKKGMFFVGFVLICMVAQSQRITLSQMAKFNAISFDELHSYLLSKGYKFYQIDDDAISKARSYAYGQNKRNIYASRVVTKYQNDNTKKQVITFQTLTSGDYFDIKNDLSNLNYRFLNTRTSNKGTKYLVYNNGKNEVTLTSNDGYNAEGEKITYYQVTLIGYGK